MANPRVWGILVGEMVVGPTQSSSLLPAVALPGGAPSKGSGSGGDSFLSPLSIPMTAHPSPPQNPIRPAFSRPSPVAWRSGDENAAEGTG